MSKIPGISALVAALLSLSVILILIFIRNDFVLFGDYVSALSLGNYGQIFGASITAAAFAAIPCGIYVYRKMGRLMRIKALFILIFISMVGIGIFPISNMIHEYFAGMFFVTAFIAMILMGRKIHSKFGMITTILGVWGLIGLIFLNPLIETFQVFVILFWMISVGVFILMEKL